MKPKFPAPIPRRLWAAVLETLEERRLFSAVTFTSATHTAFTAGMGGTFAVITTGNPTVRLKEVSKLPAGIAFRDTGSGTGMVFGTPALNAGGVYTFALSALNGAAAVAGQSFTLTIDQSPTFTSAKQFTASTLRAADIAITTTGFPAAAITEAGTLPTGFTFVDHGNGTATLTDAAGFNPLTLGTGIYPITLTATNGLSPAASQVLTLTVDQPPKFVSASPAVFQTDMAGTYTITTVGFPSPVITEQAILPNGLAFIDNGNGTASIFGTPSHYAGGSYSVVLTAANGVSPIATQKLAVIVDQPAVLNSAPSTVFSTAVGRGFVVTSGGYPAPIIDITGTNTLPLGVTLSDISGGRATLTGLPAAGTGGTYVVTLRANNGVTPISTQVFTLTVDQPPAITSLNHATFTTNDAGTFTVAAGSFPADTIVETGALPSGVVYIDNGDGTASLIGTPSADAGGKYNLKFVATSPTQGVAGQFFTLTVADPVSITSPDQVTLAHGKRATFTVTTTGFPVATISEIGALPNVIGLHDNGNGTASFFGILAANSAGTYTITLTADNHAGSVTSQAFTIIVT